MPGIKGESLPSWGWLGLEGATGGTAPQSWEGKEGGQTSM